MSKITNIGAALLGALGALKMKQEELATAMDSTQASISRLISGKTRPTRETLFALCTAIKKTNYDQAINVLIGHLEDEIEESGMLQSDIEIIPARRNRPTRLDIEKNIDIIRRSATRSRETANLVRDLAWLIKQAGETEGLYENNELGNLRVAED